MRPLATAMKSLSLALGVAAAFSLLAGATVSGSPGQARAQGPGTTGMEQQPTEEAFIARGNALLEAGDFASARLMYQAAANRGSARAAMLTGVTFDPRYQAMAGVSGTRSNARVARQWYALAMERGDGEAERNDLELVKWLQQQGIDPQESASAEDEAPAPVDEPAAAPVAPPEPQPAAAKPEPEPEAPAETAAQPPAAEATSEPSAFDARVVRAQLTSGVKDREPVDRLPSPIVVSDGRIDRIMFFSEVRDLAGRTVSHRWERGGHTMADVPFVIGGRAWRMHSSKRVTPAMTGSWRVAVVDKDGAELASVPFVLE